MVELAAGVRREGRLQITTRRRADHFLPGGQSGEEGWLRAALELAAFHADRGEEVFLAPAARSAARGEKHAVSETRWLWVDVDQPGQLHALWAFLAERPCHLLIESGGSGGAHGYWKLAEPLPATRVVEATGELLEPIERANVRIIHRLGVGGDGKPNVADPACAERSRVMRLAGTVNGKTGAYARIVEADFELPPYPVAQLVGDLPDPTAHTARRAQARRRRARTRTSGSARPSTSRSSPGSSCRATGSCHARRHRTSTGTRRARSAPTQAPGGAATAGPAGRAARSTTSPRCCSAAPGAGSCAARRSSAPAPTSPTCSASMRQRITRTRGGER